MNGAPPLAEHPLKVLARERIRSPQEIEAPSPRQSARPLMERPAISPELIVAAQAGDKEAFDEILRVAGGGVRALVGRRLRAKFVLHVEIDDAYQETLTRALGALGTFQWRGEDSFLRWLGGIADNVIAEEARRFARHREVALDVDPKGIDVSPSRAVGRDDRFARLREAVERLSPDHREVVLLTRIEGLKFAEVAERMGRSPDAVKQLFYRALRELRAELPDTESLALGDHSLSDEEAPDD